MASFYFEGKNFTLTKKTDTEVTDVAGTLVTFAHGGEKPVELPESTIKTMGLKKGSKVTLEPINNGFLLSTTPDKKPVNSPTKGSSPAYPMTLSND